MVRGLRRTPYPAQHKAYYTNYIENHIIPGIGSVPLDKLTTIQIQRFYNNLQKTGRVQRKNFPNSGKIVSAPEWCGASTRCCTTAWSRRWRSG